MTCGEIISLRDVTPATVLHHLSILVTAGLIETRREGQFVYSGRARKLLMSTPGLFLLSLGEGKNKPFSASGNWAQRTLQYSVHASATHKQNGHRRGQRQGNNHPERDGFPSLIVGAPGLHWFSKGVFHDEILIVSNTSASHATTRFLFAWREMMTPRDRY